MVVMVRSGVRCLGEKVEMMIAVRGKNIVKGL